MLKTFINQQLLLIFMRRIITVEGIMIPVDSHEGKTIVLGSDHRGFIYKNKIGEILKSKGYQLIDVGTFSSERCDYPVISDNIGKEISSDHYGRAGIGICGSGIGILIPASKHKRVYAARCLSTEEAETSRKHNNTNLLGIGADCVNLERALATIDTWLATPFCSNLERKKSYLMRYIQTVKLETAMRRL